MNLANLPFRFGQVQRVVIIGGWVTFKQEHKMFIIEFDGYFNKQNSGKTLATKWYPTEAEASVAPYFYRWNNLELEWVEGKL